MEDSYVLQLLKPKFKDFHLCFCGFAECKPFLTEFRISRGKEQLTLTNLSVEEIAVSCGYRNSLAFGKVFKQKVGITPTQYRNDNRKDAFFVRYTCINKHKEQVHRFNCKRGNI